MAHKTTRTNWGGGIKPCHSGKQNRLRLWNDDTHNPLSWDDSMDVSNFFHNLSCELFILDLSLWRRVRYSLPYRSADFETILWNIASCAIWMWNMVSYIKGGIQAKGIWKQDPEANIWAQEGWEWGVEKAPQWGTS